MAEQHDGCPKLGVRHLASCDGAISCEEMQGLLN